MQYSESQIYGTNLILKEYAKFPKILPLPCHMEHGWGAWKYPLVTDLIIDKPLMMVFNRHCLEAWKKKSKIPAVIMGSPFIHYKNLHHITKKKNAKGTVAFPGHSTPDLKTQFGIKKYCQELKNLPQKFQPITVCLYWLDYKDKTADIYRRAGFSVVTAGSKLLKGLDFVNNFYGILSQHKYATSNLVGSYTFYAVDLKIPFFLLGESPLIINKTGKDKNAGKPTRLDESTYGRIATKIFSTGPITKIAKHQAKFVSDEMGIKDCLTPKKMRTLLWHYFKKEQAWTRAVLPYWAISFLIFLNIDQPILKLFNQLKNIKANLKSK